MALSKYERRVLAEFEAELAAPKGRWHRVGVMLSGLRRRLWRLEGQARRFLVPVSVLLLGIAGCALEMTCLPAHSAMYATTATGAVAGLAAGVLAARLWRLRPDHRSTTSGR